MKLKWTYLALLTGIAAFLAGCEPLLVLIQKVLKQIQLQL